METGLRLQKQQWRTMLEKTNSMVSQIPVFGNVEGIPMVDRGPSQLESAAAALGSHAMEDESVGEGPLNLFLQQQHQQQQSGVLGDKKQQQSFLSSRANQLLGQYNFDVDKLERELHQLVPRAAQQAAEDVELDHYQQVISTTIHEALTTAISETDHQGLVQLNSEWESEKAALFAELKRSDANSYAASQEIGGGQLVATEGTLPVGRTPFQPKPFGEEDWGMVSFALKGPDAQRSHAYLEDLRKNEGNPSGLARAFKESAQNFHDGLPSSEEMWKLVEDIRKAIDEARKGDRDFAWLASAKHFLQDQYARNVVVPHAEEAIGKAVCRWLDETRNSDPLLGPGGLASELRRFSPSNVNRSGGFGGSGADFQAGGGSGLHSVGRKKQPLQGGGAGQEPKYSKQPLWAVVYYCLRAGGWNDAIEILKKEGSADALCEPVQKVLSALHDGKMAELTATLADLERKVDTERSGEPEHGRAAADRASHASLASLQSCSPWKKAILYMLLQGQDSSLFPRVVNASVQDYMWMKLSVILAQPQHRKFEQDQMLEKLQGTLRRNGAEHFSDKSDRQLFARVLLMANLPWDAAMHLAQCHMARQEGSVSVTGITEAVHLGLVFGDSLSGAELTDLAKMVQKYTQRFLSANQDRRGRSDVLIYMRCVLSLAGTHLDEQNQQLSGAALVTVQGIAEMLLKSDLSHAQSGEDLLTSLEKPLKDEVLRIAGEHAYCDGRVFDAVRLLSYDGAETKNINKAFEYLNRQLVAVLRQSRAQRAQTNVCSECLREAERFEQLEPRLSQTNRRPFTTMRELARLLRFSIEIDNERWHQALELVKGTLPTSPADVNRCLKDYYSRDTMVQEVFSKVFESALIALEHLVVASRNDKRVMAELQDQFRAYEAFNASLPETSLHIAQMLARFPM